MALGFIPLIIIGLVFGVYLNVATGSATQGSSISALELNVNLNATTIHSGQSLNIRVSLFNNLTTPNYIAITQNMNSSKVLGFPIAMWGACLSPQPVQFMIVKGNYSLAQLEALSKNTSVPWLMCMEGGAVSSLLFQPKSDSASAFGNFCSAECYYVAFDPFVLSSNFTVSGYWTYPMNSSEAQDVFTPPVGVTCPSLCYTFNYPEVGPVAQSPFTAGEYTLVVADEWGQTVLLNFAVVQ